MLIQVEAYPDSSGKVTKTLHACLATSQDDDKGVLVALGRKAGNITFPSDKSVSRQHCWLRCVGNNKEDMMAPRNDQEEKACARSDFGMCLVLENSGKGGSYVAVADNDIPKKKEQEDDNSSDTDAGSEDEETDDEGISQRPKKKSQSSSAATSSAAAAAAAVEDMPPVSSVTKAHWGSKPVKLVKMDVGDTHILTFEDKDDDETSSSRNVILVQCGRFESTLKITWMPLRLAFSRMPNSKAFKDIKSQLHRTGALAVDALPDATTTHLVTQERMGGAKQLIAWCLNIPLVPLDFLQALLDRKEPTDSLPSPEDYPIAKTDGKDFWNDKADPKLFSKYTLLSVEANDMERLAVVAGAKLVALYDHDQTTEAEAPLATAKEAMDAGALCFSISSRKKLSKTLASSLRVPLVKAPTLAKAVSRQERDLQDADGNVIGTGDEENDDDESPNAAAMEEDDPSPSRRETPKKRKRGTREDTESSKEQPETQQSLLPPSSKESETPIGQEQQPSESSVPAADDDMVVDIEEEEEKAPTKEGEVLSDDHQKSEEEKEVSQPKKEKPRPVATSSKSKRKSISQLPSADRNGWFVTAPKEKRIEWRERAAKENAEEGGGDFAKAAKTETVTFTLMSPPQAQNNSSRSSSRTTAPSRGGPNFKRFRKNSVPTKTTESSSSATARVYTLRKVLPKESEQQRMLDENQRELEEEQRRADQLFRGDGGGVGARKRRRR